ncbi:unnamed protein product [Dovyalis caffra]|uniref:BHLH domain-containing protein n=1 Tax=Dovyalis caffra TaxID=77055 RepID=A0AAV1S2Q8_9ROSI|nr:unnamed protein product [Dovyalis caffra]
MDQASTQCYDSSLLDGAASTIASKNMDSERKRRKKLNDKLLALREAVPKISKRLKKDPGYDFEQELPVLLRSKRTRSDQIYYPMSYPIEVHEVSYSFCTGVT